MFEQKGHSDIDKGRRGVGNPRDLRGWNEAVARTDRLLWQADFDKELRQTIDKTLFWYDYLSRIPKN